MERLGKVYNFSIPVSGQQDDIGLSLQRVGVHGAGAKVPARLQSGIHKQNYEQDILRRSAILYAYLFWVRPSTHAILCTISCTIPCGGWYNLSFSFWKHNFVVHVDGCTRYRTDNWMTICNSQTNRTRNCTQNRRRCRSLLCLEKCG
jgi:hypothetical protein